jgi:4-hydroxyphenylpyruvate dioxygenase-like putative hemolysin
MMGFRPVARHRSREVMLYRQGGMNVIVNAHVPAMPDGAAPTDKPVIAAIALRVRDAAEAYHRALDRGAWAVPSRVEVMELNIPAIHGVGKSRIYFVDRYETFSIYDVDFVPIPTLSRARLRWPACISSVSCSTSAMTAPKTGPSFTASCLVLPTCPTTSASASCPRAASCAARARRRRVFTCN